MRPDYEPLLTRITNMVYALLGAVLYAAALAGTVAVLAFVALFLVAHPVLFLRALMYGRADLPLWLAWLAWWPLFTLAWTSLRVLRRRRRR